VDPAENPASRCLSLAGSTTGSRAGCKVLVNDNPVDFRGIRDSFSHVAALVADFLSTRPAVTVVSDKIAILYCEASATHARFTPNGTKFRNSSHANWSAGIISTTVT
jgi:hypothetical protein